MLKKLFSLFAAVLIGSGAHAQGPEVTSWVLNTTSATSYGGILSNVQQVQYSTGNVYVSATCIPGYSIGPWGGNPNIPSNQNFVFKITRTPVKNTGTLVNVGLGHIGVWSNGVSIFNSQDAMSYNNLNVWLQNAYFFEGSGFDNCLGHPQQQGEYHHHVNPKCLYNSADSTHHSPIIGYAFDGFPIYGAYAYADTMGGGGIKRMRSSYQLRSMTARDTLPNGTAASSSGPPINSTYPLGAYIQDYKYLAGSGDLDDHNGRFCKTPEYPAGIYAYFVTIDASLAPEYPYVIGPTYYGTVMTGNTGMGSGHNSITETVTTYTPPTAISTLPAALSTIIYPNPANDFIHVFIQPVASNNFTLSLVDMQGRVALTQENVQPTITYTLDLSKIPPGIYNLIIQNKELKYTEKVLIKQ